MNDPIPDRRATDTALGDTARILALLYTVGFLGFAGALLFVDIPPDNKTIVNVIGGIMATVQTGIVGFYFGSSKNAEISQKAGIVARDKADTSLQVIAKAAAPGPAVDGASSVITTTETKIAPKKAKKK